MNPVGVENMRRIIERNGWREIKWFVINVQIIFVKPIKAHVANIDFSI
jgi:hypothetical protein